MWYVLFSAKTDGVAQAASPCMFESRVWDKNLPLSITPALSHILVGPLKVYGNFCTAIKTMSQLSYRHKENMAASVTPWGEYCNLCTAIKRRWQLLYRHLRTCFGVGFDEGVPVSSTSARYTLRYMIYKNLQLVDCRLFADFEEGIPFFDTGASLQT